MAKYFDTIKNDTNLNQKRGGLIDVPLEFQTHSYTIFSQCVYLQSLIQQIIYTTHGDKLVDAKKTLKDFPNPKARVDFLCSFPYENQDPVMTKVFSFCRTLFREIYEIRNILAHEVWSTSEEYQGSVLFSKLDENSRLLLASGKLWHCKDATPEDIYEATIRFIRNTKLVTCAHLRIVINDINLCSWSLMNINNFLNEKKLQEKEKLRQAFFVFQGTSHLFDDTSAASERVEYLASKKKSIKN